MKDRIQYTIRRSGTAAVLCFCLILPILFPGCSGGQREQALPAEPLTLSLWYFWDIPGEQRALTRLVDNYNNSQPDIKIEARYIPDEDFKKRLALSMAEGTMPDIALVDSADFRFFHGMKAFADITGRIDETDEYLPQAMEPCTIDGRIYGLPLGVSCPALIYNIDYLEEAGLSVPQTWEDFYRAACRTTNDAHHGFTISALVSEESLYTFLPILWSGGGTVREIDSPQSRKAFELLHALADSEAVSRENVNIRLTDTISQFAKGEVAMMFNTSMSIDFIREINPELNFGVTYLPSSGDSISTVGGEIFALPDGENVEQALQFLRFAADRNRMKVYLDEAGYLAPRQDLMDEQFQRDTSKQMFVSVFKTAQCRVFADWWPEACREVLLAMNEVLLGEDVDETLSQARRRIDAVRLGRGDQL